jgi:hypothetical protein
MSVFLLLGIMIYTHIQGPNSWLAQISFWILIMTTIILLVLIFYTNSFWWALLLYVVTIFIIQIVGFVALKKAIEDKTGLGVTMFSGIIPIYGIAGVLIVKLIISIW